MTFDDAFYEDLIRAHLLAALPARYLFRNKRFKLEYKDDNSPLTTADLLIDIILKKELGTLFPQAFYMSEESKFSKSRFSFEYVWIVDPIDGTREFANNNPEYSISTGLVYKNKPLLGIVVLPEDNLLVLNKVESGLEVYEIDFPNIEIDFERSLSLVSTQDLDFVANEILKTPLDLKTVIIHKKVKASECVKLGQATILVSKSEYAEGLFHSHESAGLHFKPTGSIARKLALLACGESDLVLSLRPKNEWDICAGHSLINALDDFLMTDLQDYHEPSYNQVALKKPGLVAGPKKLVEEFHKYCKSSLSNKEASGLQEDVYKEKYDVIVEGSSVGIWDWDIKTDEIFFNKKWTEFFVFFEEEKIQNIVDWKKLIHVDDLTLFEKSLKNLYSNHTDYFEIEYRMLDINGTYKWMRLSGSALYNQQGVLKRIGGSQVDITEDKAFDPITGLPNRVLFQNRLEHAFYRAKEIDEFYFTVIIISIDRFNRLVDSLGHSSVDSVMQELAGRLLAFRKETDTLARISQNEFVFLIEDTLDVVELCQQISFLPDLISRPLKHKKSEIILSASIGFSLYEKSYRYPLEMLKDATIAKNRVEKSGGASIQLFNKAMLDTSTELFEKEMELHVAIREKQMQLYYQPIVNNHNFKVLGFEALVRWNHPTKGLLKPDAFIALSEETGLIIPLGHYILEQTFQKLSEFQSGKNKGLFLSVNLSSRQLRNHDFLDDFIALQNKYKINLKYMKLEITESVAMHSIESTITLLNHLTDLGATISIDDFGTGYSSLSYLKRLPLSSMKIDRSFIIDIINDEDNQVIVQAIMALAEKLGLEVIVEGIEKKKQIDLLQSWGSCLFQGYYFGKPMSPAKLEKYIKQNN